MMLTTISHRNVNFMKWKKRKEKKNMTVALQEVCAHCLHAVQRHHLHSSNIYLIMNYVILIPNIICSARRAYCTHSVIIKQFTDMWIHFKIPPSMVSMVARNFRIWMNDMEWANAMKMVNEFKCIVLLSSVFRSSDYHYIYLICFNNYFTDSMYECGSNRVCMCTVVYAVEERVAVWLCET